MDIYNFGFIILSKCVITAQEMFQNHLKRDSKTATDEILESFIQVCVGFLKKQNKFLNHSLDCTSDWAFNASWRHFRRGLFFWPSGWPYPFHLDKLKVGKIKGMLLYVIVYILPSKNKLNKNIYLLLLSNKGV